MMDYFFSQIVIFLTFALVLFAPGYFFLMVLFGRRRVFTDFEKLAVASGLSLLLVDFLMLLMNRFGILFTRLSLLTALLVFCAACYAAYRFRRYMPSKMEDAPLPIFSRNQKMVILLAIFLTVFFKSAYLRDNLLPSSTDLGHHVYWAKLIAQSGRVQEYGERRILEQDGAFSVGPKVSIDDFIVGEHLALAASGLISGADFISSFPIFFLFLINVVSVLSIFILAFRLFEELPSGKNIAILALILAGPLFAISAPQARYVGGGVIGNLMGNLLIPLVFYFLFRAVTRKDPIFLALALFFGLGLVYTHHLSTFIFLFAFAFSLVFLALFSGRRFISEIRELLRLFLKPPVLIVLAFGIIFFFFVAMPEYIRSSAVQTVVGAPSRSTKEGLALDQLRDTVGESRAALGIVGLAFLLFFRRLNPYARAILAGWSTAIFLMAWQPAWLHIDIPSVRIANYLIFPLLIAGAFGWNSLASEERPEGAVLPAAFSWLIFAALFLFVFVTGFQDNARSLRSEASDIRSAKTFAAARYLAAKTAPDDVILKDHNYLSADAWMKVFLMRDYNQPLTRGLFFRYEPPYRKEKCTLNMISAPESPEGLACYADLGVDFVAVSPAFDAAQFEKSGRFWPVYANPETTVYYRPVK